MRGMRGIENRQETANRGEKNISTGGKGKAPPAFRGRADELISAIFKQHKCPASVGRDNGHSGNIQGKPGLRSLLESLGGEEFIVTVEFGKGAGDAGGA